MIAPPIPAREAERLRALDRYAILDTAPEDGFDEVVQLAAALCATPVALITLVDQSRQWFKARLGVTPRETSRMISFCAHAISATDDVFVVHDARADVRFAQNPLVTGDPHIRFYAGAPLVTPEGHNLGTLCVIDREPRRLTAQQQTALRSLARQVMVQLELRRKVAEKEAAEARTRAVIEHSLGAWITTDAAGTIESVNPAAERIFGYAAQEMIGRTLGSLLIGFDVAAALGRVTECPARRRKGESFPCEVSLFEVQENGDRRRLAAHMLDVTERHAVDQLKKEFISTVSHELRTPLTSIRGSLGLLASGVMGTLPPDAQAMIGMAERNSVRLIALINDILDFDKLSEGKLTLALRPTALRPVVEQSIASAGAAAMQDGVFVELAACDDVHVLGDRERLLQVMVNLLSNAVKYSDRGGVVRVSATADGDDALVRVTDRGRGIAPGLQKSLFRPFQRGDSSDARTKPGSGLGLAICKAIVERHGGAIGVESVEGEGSTFWFRVPRAVAGGVAAFRRA